MYRLVLYYLIVLVGAGFLFSLFRSLNFSPWALLLATGLVIAVCWLTNKLFAQVFEAPTNVESVYITALILVLIITPPQDISGYMFLVWAGVWAMASKYMFAIGRKHLFNPAAIAVVITALFLNQSASWWVGTAVMMPLIVIGGLLVVRKIQREDMIFYFVIAAATTELLFAAFQGGDVFSTLSQLALHSSLFFFAFVMLTEPLTTPPTKNLQIMYGILVGILFSPNIHIGDFYLTPELALVLGNIFSYLVSPKQKLFLKLKQKIQIAPDIIDFIFTPNLKLNFVPGQYMEWTLPHPGTDSRGNRRYFTIASSPTEKELRLGVKFYANSSTYKVAMAEMDNMRTIVGAQMSGDFTLPDDVHRKCVFIAGGIGITPFRSMLKYLVDKNEHRDIVVLFSNKTPAQIVYQDVLAEAAQKLGIKTIYTLTDQTAAPANWGGEIGRINEAMIKKYVADFDQRYFYISGSGSMVTGMKQVLQNLDIKSDHIVADFFPGLA